MKIISSYKIKIKHYRNIFNDTVSVYQDAISFFMDICNKEWDCFADLSSNLRVNMMERLTLRTKKNADPKYDFNERFYKMPSYLRRAAISAATGAYSSYHSSLKNWEESPVGDKPTLQSQRNLMPALYKGNMYIRTGETSAKIKVCHKNDWVWIDIDLNRQDVNYINKHCNEKKELVPSLKKQGKCWYLVFTYKDDVKLHKVPIEDQTICAVDLGINNNAVCSIIKSDGTVVARKFINLATEKDHLYKAVGRVKKAQQHGASKTPVKWKHANDLNRNISRKTAAEIIIFASTHHADTIVFEFLDDSGKKRGSKKQKLALWAKKEIQRIVEHRAHTFGMRMSRVNAWNTSRLAYDGSGRVRRGRYIQDGKERYNYSICTFSNGKQYNCDLNASYNIGARYFVRELLKSDSVTRRLSDQAKVPDYDTGSTRTLSTLIRLNADLSGIVA